MNSQLRKQPLKKLITLRSAFLALAVVGITLMAAVAPASAARRFIEEGDYQCEAALGDFWIVISEEVYNDYGCNHFFTLAEGSSVDDAYPGVYIFVDKGACSDTSVSCEDPYLIVPYVITAGNVENAGDAPVSETSCVCQLSQKRLMEA